MDGKYMQQFKKGLAEMVLLCLIARGETYGYEIITALNAHGAAVWGYARKGRSTLFSTGCRTPARSAAASYRRPQTAAPASTMR